MIPETDIPRNGGLGKTRIHHLALLLALMVSVVFMNQKEQFFLKSFFLSQTAQPASSNGVGSYYYFGNSSATSPAPLPVNKYAIVHVVSDLSPRYVLALLGSANRLRTIHKNANVSTEDGSGLQLDLVVLYPKDRVNVDGFEHPYIRFVAADASVIESALIKEGEKPHPWVRNVFFKLAPANLDMYDKVLLLDLDILIYAELTSVLLKTTPPAMVPWGVYPDLDYNSGFHILRPNKTMFSDMIDVLSQAIPSKQVLNELKKRGTREYLKSNNNQVGTSVESLSSFRSDQEFLHAFYDFIPGVSAKWGPMNPLPDRYNVREQSLGDTTHTLLGGGNPSRSETGLFTSRLSHLFGGFGDDGAGHRLVPEHLEENGVFGLVGIHFTTRKPWSGTLFAQEKANISEAIMWNSSMTPQERCPLLLHHVTFLKFMVQGVQEAIEDARYGENWFAPRVMEYMLKDSGMNILQNCLKPETDAISSNFQSIGSRNTSMVEIHHPLVFLDRQ